MDYAVTSDMRRETSGVQDRYCGADRHADDFRDRPVVAADLICQHRYHAARP